MYNTTDTITHTVLHVEHYRHHHHTHCSSCITLLTSSHTLFFMYNTTDIIITHTHFIDQPTTPLSHNPRQTRRLKHALHSHPPPHTHIHIITHTTACPLGKTIPQGSPRDRKSVVEH